MGRLFLQAKKRADLWPWGIGNVATYFHHVTATGCLFVGSINLLAVTWVDAVDELRGVSACAAANFLL
eukprot:4334114-Prymnesium_polylepis.1